MKIPYTNLAHCFVVGKVMEECGRLLNYTRNEQMKLFIIGYLHDSLSCFETDDTSHEELAYEVLPEELGSIIRSHGDTSIKDKQATERILMFADMIVAKNGDIVGFDGRLEDIRQRHGEDSTAYRNSARLVDEMKRNGYTEWEQEILKMEL